MSGSASLPEGGKTVVYSTVDNHQVQFDYWVPRTTGHLPGMIFYHGGGMSAGSRRDGIPMWMYNHCQKKGYVFISADYRLCHPCSVIDQIDDAKALFNYLSTQFSRDLPGNVSLDVSRVAVTGFSAGAYSARAACLYASPKPAALLSGYGLAGNILLDHWTHPRPPTSIAKFFDLSVVPALLADKKVISDDFGEGSLSKRFALTVHWEQTGTMLDALFQSPGLGKLLSDLDYENRFHAVPEELRSGVLHEFVFDDYPPSVFVHGKADDVVPPEESVFHHEQLQKLGVRSQLHLIENGPHGLDEIARLKITAAPLTDAEKMAQDTMKAYGEALEFIDRVFKGL